MTVKAGAALDDFAAEIGARDPVAVEGARTRWEVGGTPDPGVRLVRAPAGILEHRPEEMIVRVRAGTPVEALHAELAASGQRTALPERGGTVGGALAVGQDAVSVLGRGRVRDCLLQVRYVSAEGRVVTAGGPTVKNVSGFDLPRLLVGSLGTLGLIAEVILRTNPAPPVSRWLVSPDADPFAVTTLIRNASAVLWDGTRTWAEIEGHPADVDAQEGALAGIGSWKPTGGRPDLPANRWSLRPGDLRGLDRRLPGPFVASVGVGTVYATTAQGPRDQSATLGRLLARVKQEFDPSGRLNPGRRVSGNG